MKDAATTSDPQWMVALQNGQMAFCLNDYRYWATAGVHGRKNGVRWSG